MPDAPGAKKANPIPWSPRQRKDFSPLKQPSVVVENVERVIDEEPEQLDEIARSFFGVLF
jgi:hypothetical protein